MRPRTPDGLPVDVSRKMPLTPADEDQMVPRARPTPPSMTPTPEEEMRMRRQVEDEKMMEGMGRAYDRAAPESMGTMRRAKGGKVKAYASGGSVGNVSKRADGIAQRGKTKCRII